MKRRRLLAVLGLAGSLAVAGAVALAVMVGAFDGDSRETDTRSDRSSQGNPTGSTAEPSALAEGIQVHGDWVIEVRNPDGSVAERREFQNALSLGGVFLLTGSLARTESPGVWGVGVRSNDASESPCMTPDPVSLCLIREPISSSLSSYPATHFPTLTVSADPSGQVLVLQGNFDAPNDGIIRRVQTFDCTNSPVNVDPGACNNIRLITETTLGTPVNVIAGQQVLVTVTISFS